MAKKKAAKKSSGGIKGPADTPEKLILKGTFLKKTFSKPDGPMKNDDGSPTRLALTARAWNEPVPMTMHAARRLAAKGERLLKKAEQMKKEAKEAKETAKVSADQ